MSNRIHIRPAAGLKVRKPVSLTLLSEQGETVAWSSFWQRRLDCGDVVLVKEASAPKPQAPKPKKKGDDQ